MSPWHAPRSFDENQVLRTVRDRFWSTGYAGTGVDDILRDTGLGKGSLYGAFGDKHQLFLRAFQEARHVGLGPPWGRGAVGPWGRGAVQGEPTTREDDNRRQPRSSSV
ncbi:TetR/AcrR family transcriptional regulator [Actinacidiphila glaucinigra]|uniref:TetR/AcrR family transcriptional regulator n=1 Tax=Actinacidiphila glaucinigra TaxID=235986 RepID=UPI003AF3562B